METKDFLGKFSFQDILAYLLPGIAVMLALVYVATKLEWYNAKINELGLFSAVIFFILSFILGIISSGVANFVARILGRIFKKVDPEKLPPSAHLLPKIETIFLNEIGMDISSVPWNKDYFILARDLVYQLMPNAASSSYRQGGLRLLRAYLISPSLLWMGILCVVSINSESALCYKVFDCVIFLFIGLMLICYLWKESHENRKREVLYVFINLIALSTTKLWK
jgi:hypothetical protein